MPNLIDLREELNDALSLRDMATAFGEINTYRIRRIRAAFEKNANFYKEITEVYHLVKESSAKKSQQKGETPTLSNLRVAVTSNSHFYGHLNTDVVKAFLEDVKKNSGDDLVIIGQTGISAISLSLDPKKFRAIRFRSDFPSKEEINSLIEQTTPYDRVFLYYPQFIRFLSQKVAVLDITQTVETEKVSPSKIEYLFEPELSKIIKFFEKEVRSLLFLRVVLETELSRTAARILSMHSAQERAEEQIKNRQAAVTKAIKSIRNARLLETFSAISEWGKV